MPRYLPLMGQVAAKRRAGVPGAIPYAEGLTGVKLLSAQRRPRGIMTDERMRTLWRTSLGASRVQRGYFRRQDGRYLYLIRHLSTG